MNEGVEMGVLRDEGECKALLKRVSQKEIDEVRGIKRCRKRKWMIEENIDR